MLRYPGGKDKLKNYIVKPIACFYNLKSNSKKYEYREPFFGGGAVGIELIKKDLFKKVWINDKDISLCYLWSAVINNPEELIEEIKNYDPSPENFNKIKQQLIEGNFENENKVSIGAKKLIVHRTSFSGLGTMSGPLGGINQKGKYKNDARWNVSYLTKCVDSLNRYFKTKTVRKNKCTNLDYLKVLKDDNDYIAYLDPPYYQMGEDLYPVKFTTKQHQEMANFLQNTKHFWILSYDNSPEIRKLYSWANILEIEANYSITGAKRKVELLIYPDSMEFAFKASDLLKTRNIF